MDGLDFLGTHEAPAGTLMGFDYMSLFKGGAGILSGAGGMFGGGQAGGKEDAVAAEKRRIEAEKRKAEASARTWKIVGIVAGSLVGVGALALLLGRRTAP